jgi:hypothetical protein
MTSGGGYRFTVSVWGRKVIDIEIGPVPPPAPSPPAQQGHVQEKHVNAQLGFSASAALPRDRRPKVR